MDQEIQNNDKKKSKKKRILLLAILLLFLFIPALLFWGRDTRLGLMIFGEKENSEKTVANDAGEGEKEDFSQEDEVQNNSVEEVTAETGVDEELMVSENYKVSQVRFGGNVVIDDGKSRDTKPEIYQVKSETIISQEDDEPRILITWKTNKETLSNVSYSKSDGKNVVNATEEGYGFEHNMLLKNMEFSTIYTYKIESVDKWGNKIATEYFSAYTGDKSESIFDLITNAVEDVFGWAM